MVEGVSANGDAADHLDRSPHIDLAQGGDEVGSGRGINLVTWILGAAVLAVALLLTVRLGQRLAGGKAAARARPPPACPTPLGKPGRVTTRAATPTASTPPAPPPSNP